MSITDRQAQARALLGEAHAAAARGDVSRAIALAQEAAVAVPTDPEGPLTLARLHYWCSGDDEAGLAAAVEAQRRGAGPSVAPVAQGMVQRLARHAAIAGLYPRIADILAAPARPRRPAREGRLRVAHVTQSMAVGGVERWIVSLLRYLDRERCEPQLVLLREPGPLVSQARATGAEVVLIPLVDSGERFDPDGFRSLVAHLETCDVVHTHYGGGDTMAYQAALLAGVPVLVETLQWLCASRARHTDALLCPTRAVLEMQTFKERARLLPLGIDPREFDVAAPNALALPRPVVGRVSRLVAEKDPSTFVRAAALVAQVRPEARFALVGDGAQRQELGALAAGLGVAVTFTGMRSDVAGVLRGMDIFAYTPLGDSFGLVVAEAMAMGLPVVCTRDGALSDLIVHGQSGLLVPPADPSALAAAILRLLDDPALAERMGRVGRRWAETRFSAEIIADRHAELNLELAAGTRA